MLGPANVVGVIGVSASLAGAEREVAHDVAAGLGVRVVGGHRLRATSPHTVRTVRTGASTARTSCSRISDEVVDRLRLSAVAYSENADDARRPDRPGSRAATAHAVLRPLADLGLTKTSALAGPRPRPTATPTSRPRPAWRRAYPSASRRSTPRLAQVEAAELAVQALGFADAGAAPR